MRRCAVARGHFDARFAKIAAGQNATQDAKLVPRDEFTPRAGDSGED